MDDITIDARGMAPPEPMERVLDALGQLAPGQRIRLVIGREPHPLYRILTNNGYQYTMHEQPERCYEILIWK